MDLEKIKRLTSAVENIRKVKFVSREASGCWKTVGIEGIGYLSEEDAKALAADLNVVTAPVLKRYEKELREQLALCAKIKD